MMLSTNKEGARPPEQRVSHLLLSGSNPTLSLYSMYLRLAAVTPLLCSYIDGFQYDS